MYWAALGFLLIATGLQAALEVARPTAQIGQALPVTPHQGRAPAAPPWQSAMAMAGWVAKLDAPLAEVGARRQRRRRAPEPHAPPGTPKPFDVLGDDNSRWLPPAQRPSPFDVMAPPNIRFLLGRRLSAVA